MGQIIGKPGSTLILVSDGPGKGYSEGLRGRSETQKLDQVGQAIELVLLTD